MFILLLPKLLGYKMLETFSFCFSHLFGTLYVLTFWSFQVKIFANASRRRILQSFGWDDISKNLSTDGKATCLHVLPMSSLKVEVFL